MVKLLPHHVWPGGQAPYRQLAGDHSPDAGAAGRLKVLEGICGQGAKRIPEREAAGAAGPLLLYGDELPSISIEAVKQLDDGLLARGDVLGRFLMRS